MKKTVMRQLSALLIACFAGTPAMAATYYSPVHTFTMEDIQCDTRTYGATNCIDLNDPILGEKDGYTYYPIDSAYSQTAVDFKPLESGLWIPRDGVYNDGQIANIYDENGNVIGVKARSQETPSWKTGGLKGAWAAGLGGNSVKASTEHYDVMDHILNADWMPPLVEGTDYTYKLKDDGKILFKWGNINKEPSEVRIYKQFPLPEGFVGGNYIVTKATLTLKHRITNSPNDQIRPEDFENENATGVLPQYYAVGNQWFSAVDSTEGDGDFIPAGTLLADFDNPIVMDLNGDGVADYTDYKTNAWYTTLDRDPWGGPNPRYRFKSSKYGQDLPGVEMPQYTTGDLAITTLDLLSIKDDFGNAILQNSNNWGDYLDINPEKFDLVDDQLTADDCELSDNFDLIIYVKGEYKGVEVHNAQLMIEYIGGTDEGSPANQDVDVAVEINAPQGINFSATKSVEVSVENMLPSVASGTLNVTGTNLTGDVLYEFVSPFTAGDGAQIFTYSFTAPSAQDTITWLATAEVEGDGNLDNNSATDSTAVRGNAYNK